MRRLASGLDGRLDGVELVLTGHTGSTRDFRTALARFRQDGQDHSS
jgi:hypothetical protein